VSSYKYLGIIFDEFLEFEEGVKALAGAGGRALGKIFASHKRLHGMGFDTFTKMYESMVDPIIFYGAGVWGTKNFHQPVTIQNRAQRLFLGVHKYACNEAVNGDMGWRSASAKQQLWVLRLWNHLCEMDEDRLCKKFFNIDHKFKRSNWSAGVKKMLKSITGDDLYFNSKAPLGTQEAGEVLDMADELSWGVQLEKKSKLRTYRIFKNEFKTENYVRKYLSKGSRAVLAQFRVGITPLKIEIGRFYRIPLEFRLCEFCLHHDVIEDETHFLLECCMYNSARAIFFHFILKMEENFFDMGRVEQLNFIFNYPPALNHLVNYLHNALEVRREFATKVSWNNG
jgi:hypothetical protein